MTLGRTPSEQDLFKTTAAFCESRLSPESIFTLLYRQGEQLFPDGDFADLFQRSGRRSVPPRIVCTVMVLQRLEGLSDREAVDRFTFDARWKFACGGLDNDYEGFVHTVLVDMRERLRRSSAPDRVFQKVLEVAKAAGLVGRKRVLDSTALYDAVATQDTVTLIRSAIRGVLRVAGLLESDLRQQLRRDDDYRMPGKPACEWDDKAARLAVVDALARDAFALLSYAHGRALPQPLREAIALLATVTGQDIEEKDGVFMIVRGVAPDRVISTVDPEARHGHKTAARGFDGFKGHIGVDPDSEIITATHVTKAAESDAAAAAVLLSDLLPRPQSPDETRDASGSQQSPSAQSAAIFSVPDEEPTEPGAGVVVDTMEPSPRTDAPEVEPSFEVYGDSSYGTADLVERVEAAGGEANLKMQTPVAAGGKFAQDAFLIDLVQGTVTCPAGELVQLRPRNPGHQRADFRSHCTNCTLREQCTSSPRGRSIFVHAKHSTLQNTRQRQRNPDWKERYRATRPKVERKIAHLMRRKHGGRRARVRGLVRVAQDFAMLAAAVNLLRLAALRVCCGR